MKRIIQVLFTMVIFLTAITKLEAASYSASASATTVTIGSTVTITVQGTDAIGTFRVTSSNNNILKPTTTSTIWVEPSGTVSFSAVASGTTTITITPTDVSSGSGSDVTKSLGTKTITIKVNPKQTVTPKSSINYLTDLTIDGATLSPKFDKEVGEYAVELEADTKSINISAVKQDNKANVTGAGEVNVSEGVNVLKVVVTAENGSKRTYTIRATVKEKEPIIVTINNEEYTIVRKREALPQASDFYTESTIELNGEEIPAYVGEVTEYTLVGLKDENGDINLYIYDSEKNTYQFYKEYTFGRVVIYPLDPTPSLVPKNYIESTIVIEDTSINCYRYKNDEEIILIYGKNIETNAVNFYKYDPLEKTLQRYDAEFIKVFDDEINILKQVIIGLIAVIIIILLAASFQGTLGKTKKNNKKLYKEEKRKEVNLEEKPEIEETIDTPKNN